MQEAIREREQQPYRSPATFWAEEDGGSEVLEAVEAWEGAVGRSTGLLGSGAKSKNPGWVPGLL